MRDVLAGKDLGEYDIEVVSLPVNYPQGAEKQLIFTLLEREVPSGKLPMDVGVIVNNVGTAVSVKEALMDRKPVVERVVTVTGRGVASPKNLLARIGTPFSELISEAGGFKGAGILVLTEEDVGKRTQPQRACIRCGRCLDACPMSLMPNMLGLYALRFMLDEALQYHPMDCIECGSCSYVCPAKIPIVQLVRYLKQRNIMRKKSQLKS